MAKFSDTNRQITYGINFKIDNAALSNLQTELQKIQKMTLDDMKIKLNTQDVGKFYNEVKSQASQLGAILESTFNSNLGTFNIQKLNAELGKIPLDKIQKNFSSLGATGVNAFNSITTSIVTQSAAIKQSNELLDKMATTFKNTVRYGISSSIFNNLTNSIQKAYNYTIKLDQSLNDIRIVTNKSAEDMNNFALQANKAAIALGKSTRDYTEASLIYYQQGLSDKEVAARTETTLKAASVTGQSTSEVSEQLTAVWNGYKVSAEEAELYIDKLAAVAAATAADLEELSTGMSKVASAANLMGVDIDQLNAQLATIVSVTRQAPESVGTALKTIYARISNIQAGLDDEVSLTGYTKKMAALGVNVLDANNRLRDMGDVIEEIGNKWSTMSREQQIALSQTMAGTRQYNNLLSLFDNWDMYTDALNTSANAAGTLQKQQDIYMESTQAHLQQLSTSWERFYNSLVDQDSVKGVADVLSGLVNLLTQFTESIGGGIGLLNLLGTTAMRVFSTQIARGLVTLNHNIQATFDKVKNEKLTANLAENFSSLIDDPDIVRWQKEYAANSHLLNEEQRQGYEQLIQQNVELKNQKRLWDENEQAAQSYIDILNKRLNKGSTEKFDIENTADSSDIQQLFDRQSKNAKTLQSASGNGARTLSLSNLLEDYKRTGEGSKQLVSNLEEIQQVLTKTPKIINGIEQPTDKLYAKIKNIIGIINNPDNYPEDAFDKAIEDVEDLEHDLDKLGRELEETNKKQQQVFNEAQSGKTDNFNKKIGEGTSRLRDINTELDKINKTESIISLVGSFGQLATAMSMLPRLGDIWGNDQLTDFEKIEQTLMSTVTIITTLKFALDGLKKAKIGNIISGLGEKIINSGSGGMLQTLGGGLEKLVPSLAKVGTGAKGASAGLGAMGGSLATGIVALGAFAAAAVAVGAAIWVIYEESQKAKKEIQRLNEASEHFKEESARIAQEVSEISNSFNSYKTVVSTLSQCTRGSAEWDAALQKVHESTLDIISTYPQLLKLKNLYSTINGTTVLNQKTIEEYIAQLKKQQSIAQMGALTTSTMAKQKQLDLDKKELDSKRNSLSTQLVYAATNKNGGYQPVNPNATIPKSAIDATSASLDHLVASSEYLSNAEIDNVLKQTGASQSLIEEYHKYQDSVQKLQKSTDEMTTQILNNAKAIGSNIGEEKEDTILDVLQGKTYQEEFDKVQDYWESRMTGSGISKASGGNNKIYKEVLEELQETDQYKNSTIGRVRNGVQGSDYNRELVFRIDGEEVKKSAEEWASIIAASKANKNLDLGDLAKKADSMKNSLSAVFGDGEKGGILANALFDSDFLNLSNEQVEQIRKALNDGTLEKAISSSEAFKLAGKNNTEEFLKQIQENINNWNSKEAEKVLKDKLDVLYSNAAEGLDVTEEEVKITVDGLKKLYKQSEKTEDELIEMAESIIKAKKAWDVLSKAIKDNDSALKKWSKSSKSATDLGLTEEVGELKAAFDKIFDSDVSEQFLKDNYDNIKAMSNGSVKALDEIEKKLGKEKILSVKPVVDGIAMDSLYNEFHSVFDQLANTNIEIGASFNDVEALDKIQNFFTKAKLNEADAQAVLNQFGYEGELEPIQEPSTYITRYNPVEKIDFQPYTAPSSSYIKFDAAGGYSKVDLPGTTFYGANYTTTFVPTQEEIPGKTYYVLKGKDQKKNVVSHGANLKGSVTRTRAGGARTQTVKNASGGGGGKSGGGGSSSKPNKMDAIKNEIDRYHDVNIKLKQIDTSLKRIADAQEKAFGGDLIKNYNTEIGKLNNQITVTKEKLGIAAGEMKELQDKLKGSGVKFNNDGTISNYAAALKTQEDYVNGIIKHYNSLGAKAQEKYKDTVEKAKENFEKFKDNLERYDTVITEEIPDLQDKIQSAIDKITEDNISKFKMEVDLRLNIAESERDWNEFKKNVIDQIEDDDILGNAKVKLADLKTYLNDLDKGEVQALGKHVSETLDELRKFDQGQANVYGRDRKQSLEDLKDYLDKLTDSLTNVVELQKEIQESVIDQMDSVQDKFDKQADTFEMISDLVEHDIKLIQLELGDEAYGQLGAFYDKQQENYNNQLAFQKEQMLFWKEQMENAEAGSEAAEAAQEKWKEATEEWTELTENALENIKDKFENAINDLFKKLNDNLTSGKGLGYIKDEWDLLGKNAEQYLDDINRLQGIADIEKKYQDALDGTDNLSAQRKIKDLMDKELKNLKDADKLSQKDIERAEKKYELLVAQIALEEAQAQKNKLRLRRDTQGNYRYQYVADEEAVKQAEDKLSAAYNSLYNFDKERYQENLNNAYDTWVEYQEKMAEAAKINDPELRAEKEALIQEQYGELINGIIADNEKIREDLRESAFMDLAHLREEDLQGYLDMTQQEQDLILNGLVPQWESGIQDMIDTIKSEGGFEDATVDTFNKINDAAKEYDDSVKEINQDITQVTGDVLNGEDRIIEKNNEFVTSNEAVIQTYKDELKAVQDLALEVDGLAKAYENELKAAKEAHEYLAKENEKAANAAGAEPTGATSATEEKIETPTPAVEPTPTVTTTTTSTGPTKQQNRDAAWAVWGGKYGSGATRKKKLAAAGFDPSLIQHMVNLTSGYTSSRTKFDKRLAAYGYDTGGYTGEWGNEGRLAFLHQKELVLNAKDTEHILDSVKILRSLQDSMWIRFSSIANNIRANGYNGNNNSMLEQNVHIDATFPNVTNALEIENALNNLVNAASQRIGR